jgi:hypothetical protein
MFGSRRGGTVIGNGLKIVGNVTAEGLGSEPNQVVAQSSKSDSLPPNGGLGGGNGASFLAER